MKSTSLFLAATISLLNLAFSAPAPIPGQGYYLKVIGGNSLTSGSLLRDNNTYTLGVTPPPYDDGVYGDHPNPISVSTENTNEIIISPTEPHPGPVSGRLALVQDNGVGDWTLSKAFPRPGGEEGWNIGPDRENAVVEVYGWEFADAESGKEMVLRWKDEGRWVAAKTQVNPPEGGEGFERWVVHWLQGMCAPKCYL